MDQDFQRQIAQGLRQGRGLYRRQLLPQLTGSLPRLVWVVALYAPVVFLILRLLLQSQMAFWHLRKARQQRQQVMGSLPQWWQALAITLWNTRKISASMASASLLPCLPALRGVVS